MTRLVSCFAKDQAAKTSQGWEYFKTEIMNRQLDFRRDSVDVTSCVHAIARSTSHGVRKGISAVRRATG